MTDRPRPSATQVVEGKALGRLATDELAARVADAARVVVDVGTGDARAAWRLARAEPDTLVIGLDPAWQRMADTATRARRKPAKGGAPNLVLVNAAVEAAPPALDGVADAVTVLMPWGGLLRGVVSAGSDVCGGLRRLARPGATLEIVIGTSIWRPPVPVELADLPELTPAALAPGGELAARWAAAGWALDGAVVTTSMEHDAPATSWARRLGSGSPESLLVVRAHAL
ncbi:MAG: rRNA methyltransferase [Acidimicrobiia bacterium]|nr:rRNA methyltransferase [Acidimicrobiia bacterium]MDH4365227.1 rRNA methyltransferase [Acidimicrobiia bacterium]